MGKYEKEAQDKVKAILDQSFSVGSKLLRMMKSFDFKASQDSYVRFSDNDRIQKLSRRMGFQLFEKDKSWIHSLGDWVNVKNSGHIYSIGSIKRYLKRRTTQLQKSRDPKESLRASIKNKIIAAYK